MPEKRGKILVIRGGAIGDFILTLPAITALRATFPTAQLEVLGYPVVAELARAAGIIDHFRSIEARPLARFFARNAELDKEWAAYFESFNLIISYLYDPDDIFKTNVGRSSKAQFIQGQHRPDESQEIHATAVFLKPLERLAIFNANPIPRLNLPTPPNPNLNPNPNRPLLAAHPGSGSERKNWPEENWIELLRSVTVESACHLLLVGGEAEGERLTRIRASLPAAHVRLAQNLPLVHLAGLLTTSHAFIGHDSGITHLAAALNIPSLVLWGQSRDEIWRPLNPQTTLLNAPQDELDQLPVPEVKSALARLLAERS